MIITGGVDRRIDLFFSSDKTCLHTGFSRAGDVVLQLPPVLYKGGDYEEKADTGDAVCRIIFVFGMQYGF